MTNNDLLIRLRYALDMKDSDMVEIFKLGGIDVRIEEVQEMLVKLKNDDGEEIETVDNRTFESFLNGLITFKRGPKPGQTSPPELTNESPNNLLLKKVKIALELTTEDILDVFDAAGITVTKGELGALLRKKGHKNYKECLDKYARNFLKGLAIKYRK